MSVTCCQCGVELEAPNSSPAKQSYCALCQSRRRHQLQFLHLNVAVFIAAGLLLIFASRAAGLGWFLLNIALLELFGFVTTIIHETGHAVMAALMGMRVRNVVIGAGPTLLERRLFGGHIVFKAFALGGGYTVFTHPTIRFVKLRHAICLLAGPISNFVAVAVVLWIFGPSIENSFPAGSHLYPGLVFVAANLLVFVVNLYPQEHHTDLGKLASDGLQFGRLFSRKPSSLSPYVAAHFHYMSGEHIAEKNYTAAREAALQGVSQYPEPDYTRALLLNQVAWCNLLIGDRKLMEEARQFATAAHQLAPDSDAIQGTLGSVLIEYGNCRVGLLLLLQSNAKVAEGKHRAENLAYIAIAHHRLGDAQKAQQAIQEAVALDKDGELTQRAVRVLGDPYAQLATEGVMPPA